MVGVHEGLPPGVSPADNELGWQQALARLASLVENKAGPATSAGTSER